MTNSAALFRAANLIKLDYPFAAALQSALNVCDEAVIVVGPSEDETLDALYDQQHRQGKDRVKIIEKEWAYDRNWQERCWNWGVEATDAEWLMYHDFDEAVLETDATQLIEFMHNPEVKVIKFPYIHLYGSPAWRECRDFYRYNSRLGRRSANYRMVNLCSDNTPNHAVCHMLIDIGGDTEDAHRYNGPRFAFAPGPMFHAGWIRTPQALGASQALHHHWYADGGGDAGSVIENAQPYDYQMAHMLAEGRICAYKGPYPICLSRSVWSYRHDQEWAERSIGLEVSS